MSLFHSLSPREKTLPAPYCFLRRGLGIHPEILRETLRQRYSLGDLLSLSKRECQVSSIVLEGKNVLWSKIFAVLEIPLPQRWLVGKGLPPMHLAQYVWPEVPWEGPHAVVFYGQMVQWGCDALRRRFPAPQDFLEALLHLPWGTRGGFPLPLEGTSALLTLRVLVSAAIALEEKGLSFLQNSLHQTLEPSRETLAHFASLVWPGMLGEDPMSTWRAWEEQYYRSALLREMHDPLQFLETHLKKDRILEAPITQLESLFALPFILTSQSGLMELLGAWRPEDPLVQQLSAYWWEPRLLLQDLRDGKEPATRIPPRVLAFFLGLGGDYYDRRPADLHVRVARMIDYLED